MKAISSGPADTVYIEPITPAVAEHPLGQVDDLAVAVAVATHTTDPC